MNLLRDLFERKDEGTRGGNARMKGTVKWFNEEKGYGFIAPEDGSEDVFVHYSGIEGEGFRKLRDDDRVEFETEQGRKGVKAVSVRVVAA